MPDASDGLRLTIREPLGVAASYTGLESPFSVLRPVQSRCPDSVVSILPWENQQDVVRAMNDVEYGLSAAIWTNDLSGTAGQSGGPGRHRVGERSVAGPRACHSAATRTAGWVGLCLHGGVDGEHPNQGHQHQFLTNER